MEAVIDLSMEVPVNRTDGDAAEFAELCREMYRLWSHHPQLFDQVRDFALVLSSYSLLLGGLEA